MQGTNYRWPHRLYTMGFGLNNFPDDISSIKISQRRVNDGDDANIRAIADIVVDDEPEVGDVDDGDGLTQWTSIMFNIQMQITEMQT